MSEEATFCSACGRAVGRQPSPISPPPKKGMKTWQIVALILSGVAILGIVAVVVIFRSFSAVSEAAQTEIPSGAMLGDCVFVDDSGSNVVSCDEAHKWEIYHTFVWPGGPGHPDADALLDVGWSACEGTFESFVGSTYLSSDFDYEVVGPKAIDWAEGEQTIRCALYDFIDDTLVGSAQATGR